jgi:NTE family protein
MLSETDHPASPETNNKELCEPVQYLDEDKGKGPEPGMALCLSGGGYRAMLFHVGVLLRLNELGLLPELKRISSVSGGSITAGVLALNWDKLDFKDGISTRLDTELVKPIRELARHTIDVPAILKGIFWFGSIGDKIAGYYRKYLFKSATLQNITSEPRFVFNATNLQSGVLWRFMKPYMRDYRVGEVKLPTIELATAVAASSAFPPVLSPVVLKLDPKAFTSKSGTDLQTDEYCERVILSDGGVYDNLGLETAWKRYQTILVSDAGLGFKAQPKVYRNWISQAVRTLFTIDNQVRGLRRRQIVGAYYDGDRKGAFWTIEAKVGDPDAVSEEGRGKLSDLALIPTRLKRIDDVTQERLINWGYTVCDAGLRRHMDSGLPEPGGLPYPARPVEALFTSKVNS